MYDYLAKITRVIDGDTIDTEIELGFGIKTVMRFRVAADDAYFDTPETWRPKSEAEREHGKAATARAKELLEGKTFKLSSIKKGKYRFVAKIELEDGSDFGTKMINEGFQKKENY